MKRNIYLNVVFVVMLIVAFATPAWADKPNPGQKAGLLLEGSGFLGVVIDGSDTSIPDKSFKVAKNEGETQAKKVPDTCEVTGTSRQVEAKQVESQWVFDPYLTGCNVLVEGRKDASKVHHIWVLRSNGVTADQYLDADGLFHFMEGSVWVYDSSWNMDDFRTEKPSISAEFADDKAMNMIANGYSWPIIVHPADPGSAQIEFQAGEVKGIDTGNKCAYTMPTKIVVMGVFNSVSKIYVASVGAAGCVTVALIDGQLTQWVGPRDNLRFHKIDASLMPSNWDQDTIDKYVADNLTGK